MDDIAFCAGHIVHNCGDGWLSDMPIILREYDNVNERQCEHCGYVVRLTDDEEELMVSSARTPQDVTE